jgi:branched-chain amino acid transport system substrate-binding protein
VEWAGSPISNVAQTAVAGGQWRRAKRFAFDLHITETHFAPGLTPDGETLALPVP